MVRKLIASSSEIQLPNSPKQNNSNCIIYYALSKQHCIKNWIFFRLDTNKRSNTFISDIAATVSVAQRTLLTNNIY